MCNPRRIRVEATRELGVSWDAEVRRRVVRSGRVSGRAQVREPLRGAVGAPVLAALDAVLARTPGWEPDGDAYRYSFEGGSVAYDPGTGELEIEAVAEQEVEIEGEAVRRVGGRITGSLRGEGEGMHYDDNWGDRTAEDARADAEAEAGRSLDEQQEQLLSAARRQAEDEVASALEAEAEAHAERVLALTGAEREAELQRAARGDLEAIGVRGRNLFHRALAEAYRDVLLAYAGSRGAERVRCCESDGVLEIDFELRI